MFDTLGNPIANGAIGVPGAEGVDFGPEGELFEKTRNQSYKVIVVDNFNDYYDPQIKKDRIKKLKQEYNNLTVYQADISDYKAIEKIFQSNKIDKVCNLAAQAGVRYSLLNPSSYVNSNIVGFSNLLELCRHNDVKDFIYASSYNKIVT